MRTRHTSSKAYRFSHILSGPLRALSPFTLRAPITAVYPQNIRVFPNEISVPVKYGLLISLPLPGSTPLSVPVTWAAFEYPRRGNLPCPPDFAEEHVLRVHPPCKRCWSLPSPFEGCGTGPHCVHPRTGALAVNVAHHRGDLRGAVRGTAVLMF